MRVRVPGGARLLVAVVSAATAVAVGGLTIGQAGAAVGSGPGTVYVPLTPCRLIDTRPAPDNVGPRSAALAANDTFTIDALPPAGGCPIPATATALQLNVTAVDAEVLTFLTIWPSNVPRPNASSLNPSPGQGPTPNAVTTALSPDGRFNVFNLKGSVNVIIDVVGFYDDARAVADEAVAAAAPKAVFNVGTAMSIPANQCIFVFAFGVGAAGDAGKTVSGYITDSGGVNPPPSINNLTVFLPGTIFKTSQGGTIGFVQVCNPTTDAKALPAGWKLISSVKA